MCFNLSSSIVTADIAENNLIELLKEFEIVERNKVSLEIKLAAIAMYLLSSSLRRALECWNRFCRMFMFYFNVVRGCY